MNDLNTPSEMSKKEQRAQEKAAQAQADRDRANRANMKRAAKYLGLFALLAAVVVALVMLIEPPAPSGPVALPSEVTADDWTEGNPEASVVLVEYSDLQCPTCATYNPAVTRLIEEYGDDLLFVYRHFPLKSIHPNAEEAARAAEAAGKQDKFFEMTNVLFARQNEWTTLGNPQEAFESYAESLGLNIEQFRTDYDSKDVKDAVDADYTSAVQAGLSGTPTFFLNGQMLETNGLGGYNGLKARIENALEDATAGDTVTE